MPAIDVESMTWIESLELLREEHAMLAFDNQIITVEQGEYGAIQRNQDASYFHLPSTILLASSAH